MRSLSLIRHGQYEPSDEGGILTARGRKQARATGKRLAAFGCDTIYTSTLSRAIESAALVSAAVGVAVKPPRDYLCESMPTAVRGHHVSLERRRLGRERVETIVATHLKPSPRDRHDVLVCHGNIIRAVVALALGMRLTTWTQMFIHHGSLTQLLVRNSGRVALVHYNDIGHFPPSLISDDLAVTRPR